MSSNIGVWSSVTRQGRTEPFDLQVVRGQVGGHNTVQIFGYSTSIGDYQQAIWEGSKTTTGGDYVFPTSSATLTLVSTSASDTMGIFIAGLDINFNMISETVTLNGTTGVASVNSYYRINGLYVVSGSNVGTITAVQGAGTTVYGQINPGNGITQMSVYTVPKGYTFFKTQEIYNGNFSGSTNATVRQLAIHNMSGTVNVGAYLIPFNGNTVVTEESILQNNITNNYAQPFGFGQGTDIKWQAITSGGGVNGSVSVAVYGYLIQNSIQGSIG
jgi:hypothetical protein